MHAFRSEDVNNLINNGYQVFPNNTVYLNGTHVGYVYTTPDSAQQSTVTAMSTSTISAIVASVCVLGLLGLLAFILVARKKQKKSQQRISMMKDVSFDRYVTNMEGLNAIELKDGAQMFKATNNSSVLSSIQINDNNYTNKSDVYYNNPSSDAKKNSTEFVFHPKKQSMLNRLSTTLYQNKMKPHKKTMLPVMSDNKSGIFNQLKFRQ
jgi:preprotein translocase subunit YajC